MASLIGTGFWDGVVSLGSEALAYGGEAIDAVEGWMGFGGDGAALAAQEVADIDAAGAGPIVAGAGDASKVSASDPLLQAMTSAGAKDKSWMTEGLKSTLQGLTHMRPKRTPQSHATSGAASSPINPNNQAFSQVAGLADQGIQPLSGLNKWNNLFK